MALGIASVFWLLFERPFVATRSRRRGRIIERSEDQGAYGAIVSTASASNTVS